MAVQFLHGIDLAGTLELKSLSTNTSSTTALVMSGDEVQKRTLGTAAFVNTTDLNLSGDYVPLAGGTMTGNLTIQHDSNPYLELKDTTSPELEFKLKAANSYAYIEVDNNNDSGSSRLQIKIDGTNTAVFQPNEFVSYTPLRFHDENNPSLIRMKRKNTSDAIGNGADIGRVDFLVQDTVGSTSEETVAKIWAEAAENHTSTSKKTRVKVKCQYWFRNGKCTYYFS